MTTMAPIDGNQLLLPIEGQLADERDVMPAPIQRQILRALERLQVRVRNLERGVGLATLYLEEW